MERCPGSEQLRRLLADELQGAEAEAVEDHVERCASCQQELEHTSGDTGLPPRQGRVGLTEGEEGVPRPPNEGLPTTALADVLAGPTPLHAATDAASMKAGPGALPPVFFGRYRILRELGQGGMGRVYVAHDTQLDRQVALKVPSLGVDEHVIARFYREARIAARFTHPNLCPVHDVGEVGGVHYLTMPLLDGETLLARLRRVGPLPEAEAARLTCIIARAMQVAHAAGVVHRDLKPANVMLNERGEPVVMDFGLARSAGPEDARPTRAGVGDVRLTASGVALGTPAYAPPELLAGAAEAAGLACDIYSLGVILYELLTGRLPFEGRVDTLVQQALAGEPPPPSRYRPELDPRLEAACLTALARDPRARFASMERFAAALEHYLRSAGEAPAPRSPPRVVPPTWTPRGSTTPKARAPRRLRRLGAALAGGGLLAALLVWGVWGVLPAAPDPLPVGSEWSGSFGSRPPVGTSGDVRVVVTERDGDTFRGTCTMEHGDYRWRIEGTLRAREVRWEFVGAVREKEATRIVGKARAEGTFDGRVMEVVYRDEGSTVPLKLSLDEK